MPKLIDLTGQRFGRLTVVERAGYTSDRNVKWLCRCDCGNTRAVGGNDLKKGATRSCGCLRDELVAARFTTHGATVKEKLTPEYRLYRIWRGMRDRCYNPHDSRFHKYGGYGITVCEEWKNDFEAFRKWALMNGYGEELTIDRKDNSLGYTPGNCRWATPLQQTVNRRNTRYITFGGRTKTLKEWSVEYGLPYHVLKRRIDRGWSVGRALTEPVRKQKNK